MTVARKSLPDAPGACESWTSPIDLTAYDRMGALTKAERRELASLVSNPHKAWWITATRAQTLERLISPVSDVAAITCAKPAVRTGLIKLVLLETGRRGMTFWGWNKEDWRQVLCTSYEQFQRRYGNGQGNAQGSRLHLFALAYLFRCVDNFRSFGRFEPTNLARRVFGEKAVNDSIHRVSKLVLSWGYVQDYVEGCFRARLAEALLNNRSPRLEDLKIEALAALRDSYTSPNRAQGIDTLSRVLVNLGIANGALTPKWLAGHGGKPNNVTDGIALKWLNFLARWRDTSTLSPRSRQGHYYQLLETGRWATQVHPEAASPELWTREIAAQWVAEVRRMTVGQWTTGIHRPRSFGRPLMPKTQTGFLSTLRTFFRDCQEWEWIPRRFDPGRVFAVPRSLKSLIGPDPRVIADDVWAKLLWAGLNIAEADVAGGAAHPRLFYPLPMFRAVSVVWLFAGLRSDEIHRLRVGCIRWSTLDGSTDDTPDHRGTCLLDVPVSKTNTAFSKPVDRLVGEVIEEWERVRPIQPPMIDRKTAESVHFLFVYRTYRIGPDFLNRTLIPALCRKAGIPQKDARGNITIHRARSTIASQLFNAKEPMSLFELQEWLGHRSPQSTQYYAKVSPTKLTKSYKDAAYFQRNLRSIKVLIDQDAVRSAAAATEPWLFYDLGHGYCTYDFFDRCVHRMACAKCQYYRPKSSSESQFLEGKKNLLRLRQEIPLRDEEMSAIEDGMEAFERLLSKLADVPTPGGPTPRQLEASALVQVRPLKRRKGEPECRTPGSTSRP